MFFIEFERPLSGKADVQILVFEKSLRNGRHAPDCGPSADRMMTGRNQVLPRFGGHLKIGAIMRKEVSYDEEEAI